MDTTRLLYIVDHPIQYQAPLLRRIASEPGIELKVAFRHLGGADIQFDPGFGRSIAWDVPLLDGYEHTVALDGATLAALIDWSDVVWLHGWQGSWMRKALRMANAKRRPLLMRGENTDKAMPDGTGPRRWLKRHYLGRIFAMCTAFLCIGSDNRRYYQNRGIPDTRLFSMPYAVDNDFFQAHADEAAKDRETLCRELGLEPGRPVILFAGKFSQRKNPIALLHAFQSLDRTATHAPYLVYVGDGDVREDLMVAADGDPAVKFEGFRNQTALPAIYDLADIFVLASNREPWGLAVNEAMNANCAVIVSNECGCAADLIDSTTGRIVPAGSVSHLASAITELLADPSRTREMGRTARQRISQWNFESDVAGLKRAIDAVSHGIDRS